MDPKATMRGLLEERRGYELRGLGDRVAQVDAEVARLGAALEPEPEPEPVVEPEAPVADGEAPWFGADDPADADAEPEAPVAESAKRKR